ncbi:DUF7446 family protein [Paenibacillus medicaginis]|uniref:Uncharacterized protein n=1 Tax=Paenibacillus medicaginis TaxID=1470560 RepID=A0ABV5BUS8_9BACL
MTGVKWNNYVVVTTLLGNQIVIGKVDKGGMSFSDKSENRTNQVITAVKQHMEREFAAMTQEDPEITNLIFTFNNGSKLTYTPPSE